MDLAIRPMPYGMGTYEFIIFAESETVFNLPAVKEARAKLVPRNVRLCASEVNYL